MPQVKTLRLAEAAVIYNVDIYHIAEALHQKGLTIKVNPSSKLNPEMIVVLEEEFGKDKSLKRQSLGLEPKHIYPEDYVINNFLTIENFKSIQKIENLELGRVNVFIGANGSGKTNILEAIALLSAAETLNLNTHSLISKGVRVTKPNLTLSSFLGTHQPKSINISLRHKDGSIGRCKLTPENPDDIYTEWRDETVVEETEKMRHKILNQVKSTPEPKRKSLTTEVEEHRIDKYIKESIEKYIKHMSTTDLAKFVIFNINTNALRGINSESYNTPLGIYGEGLDLLIANMPDDALKSLSKFDFIPWLKEYKIDRYDRLKAEGYKLGHSKSTLYFVDKYMKRNNNIFSAENANEGALHLLFYLTLMISVKTPSFFAIDNIDNTLNPRLCERLMANVAILAKEKNKQVLITTHNPASLDGLDLTDDAQRLFVVKRNDQGHTVVERIKMKPSTNGKKYNLSQLFMEDYLGGLNETEF